MVLLLLLAAFFACGYLYGQYVLTQRMTQRLSNDPDSIINMIMKIKEKNEELEKVGEPVEVVIEESNNSYFVYNKETHLFLGQGPTVDDAMKIVTERFPSSVFVYETE
jgi:hypothetical protein